MRFVAGVTGALILVAVPVCAALTTQMAGGTKLPHGSLVQVTGYNQVAPYGTRGPVVVEVGGRKAAAILAAYAQLRPSLSGPDCVEALNAFTISVVPHRGAHPVLTATEFECPSPGVASVRVGTRIRNLEEDCAFRNAVVAALPPDRAEGTRHDEFADCGP